MLGESVAARKWVMLINILKYSLHTAKQSRQAIVLLLLGLHKFKQQESTR